MALDPYQRIRPAINLLRRTLGESTTKSLAEFARRAIGRMPSMVSVPEVLFTKAHQLSAEGRYQEAVKILDDILAKEPRNFNVLVVKGQILAAESRLDDALAAMKAAEAIDPENVVVIESLARIENALGNLEASLAHFRRLANSKGLGEEAARMIGQNTWDLDEKRRDSSIFRDVEDGVEPAEAVVAEVDRMLAGAKADDPTVLSEAVIKLARQIAAQRSVLGRLDTIYTLNEYTLMQGRFRNMALHRHRNTSFERPLDPPAEIPDNLRAAFSMNGKVELLKGYTIATLPVECSDGIDDEAMLTFLALNRAGLPVAAREKAESLLGRFEPIQHSQASKAFKRISDDVQYADMTVPQSVIPPELDVARKSVAVVAESDTFMEAVLLCMCRELTSVRRRAPVSGTKLFKGATLGPWLADDSQYDVLVCRGLIDSWGLGRFGEPLDANADLKLMQRLRAKLKPGGTLHAVVPVGRDRLVFNTTRIYGEHRLPALLAGWRQIAGSPVSTSQRNARVAERLGLLLTAA